MDYTTIFQLSFEKKMKWKSQEQSTINLQYLIFYGSISNKIEYSENSRCKNYTNYVGIILP